MPSVVRVGEEEASASPAGRKNQVIRPTMRLSGGPERYARMLELKAERMSVFPKLERPQFGRTLVNRATRGVVDPGASNVEIGVTETVGVDVTKAVHRQSPGTGGRSYLIRSENAVGPQHVDEHDV